MDRATVPDGGSPIPVRYDASVQTRYLILASLATGLLILGATALWLSTL
ncbi:MAG: hypothetical protein R6W79_10590 [Acidimicrobiia bacterium]